MNYFLILATDNTAQTLVNSANALIEMKERMYHEITGTTRLIDIFLDILAEQPFYKTNSNISSMNIPAVTHLMLSDVLKNGRKFMKKAIVLYPSITPRYHLYQPHLKPILKISPSHFTL